MPSLMNTANTRHVMRVDTHRVAMLPRRTAGDLVERPAEPGVDLGDDEFGPMEPLTGQEKAVFGLVVAACFAACCAIAIEIDARFLGLLLP